MAEYAHPESLVSTDWVAQHSNEPNVRLVEVDVDTSAYEQGHITGVDVRSPQEFSGELLAPPNLPQEGSQRGGHIPRAANIQVCR
jgi:3-mercaptopyruvate sulfurtransferase SseA